MNNGYAYPANGSSSAAGAASGQHGGYADTPSAGPSSGSSSSQGVYYDPNVQHGPYGHSVPGPPQLRKRTSSLLAPIATDRESNSSDGFLGDVARWTQDQSGLGQRTSSRVMGGGGRFSNSPPPMAPPPSDPPPFPSHVHPYAAAGSSLHGPGPFARAAAGRGNLPPVRKSSMPFARGSPNTPPPASALPSIPDQASGSPLAGPGPSTLAAYDAKRHTRQSSLASYRSQTSRNSMSPPGSPTQTISSSSVPPSISPRTSSLSSPPHGDPHILETPPYMEDSPSGSSTAHANAHASRLPSRQLLQSALDLAQKAVEMDRQNDTKGALEAYQEAVTRLRLVMERVGVEPSKADGKRRAGRSDEEGRTLRGIHDAYVTRIQLLMGHDKDPVTGLPKLYERNVEPPPSSEAAPSPLAATSTATLVPNRGAPRAPSTHSDRTPRPSIDHSADDQMARLSIADPTSPARSSDVPSLERPISTSESNEIPASRKSSTSLAPTLDVAIGSRPTSVTLQQAIDDVEVQTPIQAELSGNSVSSPTTSEEPVSSTVPEQISPTIPYSPPAASSSRVPDATSVSSSASPRRIQKLKAQPLGIDAEAGLPDDIEAENVEILNGTPRGPDRPSGEAGSSRRGSTEDKALPPIPMSAPGARNPIPAEFHAGKGLVSASTALGTISQRRLSRNQSNSAHVSPDLDSNEGFQTSSSGPVAFPTSPSSSTILGAVGSLPARIRAKSQPDRGHRPTLSGQGAPPLPGLPPGTSPRKKTSLTFPRGLRINVGGGDSSLMPPASISEATPRSSGARSGMPGSLISPLPEPQPNEVLHRPFHILRIIHRSMDDTAPGIYLTGAIHISSSVWRPTSWTTGSGPSTRRGSNANAPPKIVAQDIKFRVIQQLLLHLAIVKSSSLGLLDGVREFRYGEAGHSSAVPSMPPAQITRIAQDFDGALEALEEEMEGCYKLLTKAGVGVGAWKGKAKKSGAGGGGWGSSIKSKVGGMTKDKVMDTPDKYVDILETLSASIQTLDHHLLCVTGPCTPAYHAIPPSQYHNLETRLVRCAEFVGAVVVPFVLDDMKQFFLRYLKGGVRYLED